MLGSFSLNLKVNTNGLLALMLAEFLEVRMQTRLKQVIYVSEKTDTSSDSLTIFTTFRKRIIWKVESPDVC